MKIIVAIFTLALCAAASPALAADQFDLICKGTTNDSLGGRNSPVQVRYRIDLGAMRWCEDACPQAARIAEVTADRIYLEKDEVEIRKGRPPNFHHYIDRTTGFGMAFAAGLSKREVTCEAAPFSGMPQAKF